MQYAAIHKLFRPQYFSKHEGVFGHRFARQADQGQIVTELPQRDGRMVLFRQRFVAIQPLKHLASVALVPVGWFLVDDFLQLLPRQLMLKRQTDQLKLHFQRSVDWLQLACGHATDFTAQAGLRVCEPTALVALLREGAYWRRRRSRS